jgi:hypothetical protein
MMVGIELHDNGERQQEAVQHETLQLVSSEEIPP